MELIATIKETLGNRSPKRIKDSSFVDAGVLMPLFVEQGECKVLLTKRTTKVEHHKGQISFPGGTVDQDDGSFEKTALREAHEEIGLFSKDVHILGRIDDTLTLVSNFVVHPFVGHVPHPYEFIINKAEVEKIITVPLGVFHPMNLQYHSDHAEYDGIIYKSKSYRYNGDVIWGATARMIENFVDILGDKMPLPAGDK